MQWLLPVTVAYATGVFILVVISAYLYLQYREKAIRFWALSWGIYFLRFLCLIISLLWHDSFLLSTGYYLSIVLSAIFLFHGTLLLIGQVPAKWPLVTGAIIGLFVVFALLTSLPILVITLVVFGFQGLIYILTGNSIRRNVKKGETTARIAGWLFIAWGIHQLDYPLLRPIEWFAPFGFLLGAVFSISLALVIILMFFEQTQNKLRKNEAQFRKLAESTDAVAWEYDLTAHKWLYVAPQSEKILGYSGKEWAGFDFWTDHIYPEDRAKGAPYSAEMTSKGLNHTIEYRFRRKDGRCIWLHSIIDVEMHKGIPKLLRGYMIDITERKRAEEALQASEKKFKDLLQNIQLVAVMLDCDGNITFCNDYLLGLTGWTRDEVLNSNWFDLFIPLGVRDSVKSVFNACLGEEAIMHYENPIMTRTGSLRLIVWDNAVLRNPEGTVIGTASIGVDVTEHRKIEEHLRQSQKIEAIGTLAGGVAHDFNNILTLIIGYGSLLNDKIPASDPLHLYVNQILASSERAANLTHSLLAFSRKQVIDLRPVNINDIVVDVKQMLDRVIGEDIEFKAITSAHDLIVKADKSQLEQVLMNLATNARDAMPHGGRLTITTEEVETDEQFVRTHRYGEVGKYAVISVADTGTGMDEKTRENIFDPFFTTKEIGKGTGLGLAMVYGTIKQHDGFIDVYSEPGEGTTFRLYLPLAVSGVRVAEEKPSTPFPTGNETILLVEDNDAVRKITKTLLQELGYTVIEAVDGEHAIRLFMENKDVVQLVMSDVIMPKQSGRDVQNELTKIRPDVKVLFISGYSADILTQKGIMDEAVNFLSKPLRLDVLSRRLREVLDK